MVSARRRYDAGDIGARLFEPVEIDKSAARLEGADRRMVLVFDHDVDTGGGFQQRPSVLRRRRYAGPHDGQRGFDVSKGEHGGMVSGGWGVVFNLTTHHSLFATRHSLPARHRHFGNQLVDQRLAEGAEVLRRHDEGAWAADDVLAIIIIEAARR